MATEFFWPCGCTSEAWQREFNGPDTERGGIAARTRQPRCGMCLRVARFLAADKMDQALELKALYSAQFAMSSWLAAQSRENDPVQIPRRTAVASAGWPGDH